MGQRRFKEGFQAVSCAHGLGLGVIEGAQIAQRLKEFRGQNQGQEACREGHGSAVMTKIESAQVGETKIDGDQRNRQGGKELQYPGG